MAEKKKIEKKDKRTEISDIGKRGLLEMLFEKTDYKNHRLNISAKSDTEGAVALAQKTLLEGIDFDLIYTPLKHLGYKSVLNVLGDLYAGLFKPEMLSVNLGISAKFSVEQIVELWEGMIAAAKEHGIVTLSLDVNSSMTGLTLGLSATGRKDPLIEERCEPSANYDLICLTGNIGAAYMGLLILNREKVAFSSVQQRAEQIKQPDLSAYKYVLHSYLSPEISPGIIERFIESDITPSSGFFVTKGLADSVKHLCRESGFGAKIYLERIPISAKTLETADELNLDAVTAALNGGDDFKFIFTIPLEKNEQFRKDFQDYDIIGHLTDAKVGSVLVTPEGAEFELKAQGW